MVELIVAVNRMCSELTSMEEERMQMKASEEGV